MSQEGFTVAPASRGFQSAMGRLTLWGLMVRENMVDQSCLSQDKQEAERRGSRGPGFLFKGTFSSDLIFHQDPLPKGFNHLPGVPWAGHQASTLRLLGGRQRPKRFPGVS